MFDPCSPDPLFFFVRYILQRGLLPQFPVRQRAAEHKTASPKVDTDQQVNEIETSRARPNRVKSPHRASQQTRAHFPILAFICTPQCASTTVVARSLITASSP